MLDLKSKYGGDGQQHTVTIKAHLHVAYFSAMDLAAANMPLNLYVLHVNFDLDADLLYHMQILRCISCGQIRCGKIHHM